MVDEQPGSPEWARIQAKLWCSLPSAQLARLQRVQNPKLWAAFVGPVAESRDAGGCVRVDHDSSSVREVCLLLLSPHHTTVYYGIYALQFILFVFVHMPPLSWW